MPQVTITDIKGSGEIDLTVGSLAASLKLDDLKSTVTNLTANLDKPVTFNGTNAFSNASFTATFEKPSIALKGNTLDVKASVNSAIGVTQSGDSLFGSDDYDPVKVQNGDCWVSFELDTLVDATLSAPLPDGFGVSFEKSSAPQFATYVRFAGPPAAPPTLAEAIGQTLDRFQILDSADDVLAIPPDVIYTSDVAGTVTLGASWALPLSINQYSLAQANLPFNESIAVAPSVTLKIAGDVAVTSEYNVRIRKSGTSTLDIGLYHKSTSELDVAFTAGAGLATTIGNRDLVETLLQALWPKVDASSVTSGLSTDVRKDINQVLKDSLDRSLSISFNSDWSRSRSHEPVFVYRLDISKVDAQIKSAIETALAGDWTELAQLVQLGKATLLCNAVLDTVQTKHSTTVNLLGIYNYRTVSDFVTSMRAVLHEDTGAVTITDKATATTITTGSTAKNLRKVLYEGFAATAAYQAMVSGIGASPSIQATQDLVSYKASLDYRKALKELRAGVALGAMANSVLTQLPQAGAPVKNALFQASRSYTHNDVLRFFFSDIRKLTPRTFDDLSRTGRQVLSSLLDPEDTVDQSRIAFLNDDARWAAVDGNPVNIAPVLGTDYLDITWWAQAIAKAAPLMAKAIRYASGVSGNPMLDPTFQADRQNVIAALEAVGRKSKAAFDDGFSICVMSTLAGTGAPTASDSSRAEFSAQWNGATVFATEQEAAAAKAA